MAKDEKRPALSGSNSRHCRMKLWLGHHGHPEEPVQPGARRTFDLGTIIEAAMFRGVEVDLGGGQKETLGPWWKDLGEVRDYATGKTFTANMDQVSDFQRTVKFHGLEGHIDALLKIESGLYVVDTKTTQGFGYDRHLTGNLEEDAFAKEYIGQLHFYAAGLREEGLDIVGGVLVFFNKEQSNVMARFVDYNPSIVEEIKERLAAAQADAEPEPDYAWEKGKPVSLRCRYCSFRESCAKVRGVSLVQSFDKKGKPQWVVGA